MFDGYAGSIADKPVFMLQVWPCEVDRSFLRVAVISFEFPPQVAGLGIAVRRGYVRDRALIFFAIIIDAIKIRFKSAAACQKIQRSVRSNDSIRQGEWCAR